MAYQALKTRRRSDYPFHLDYRLRWIDNDMYAHMNNNVYGHLFDSIVNAYLATHCGRSPTHSTEIGIIVTSWCHFFGQLAYPAVAECGLRVNVLGRTSVAYEIGVFEQGCEDVRAVGGFTHVFCDRDTFRPQGVGMCDEVRTGLLRILVRADEAGDGDSDKVEEGASGGSVKSKL